MFMGSWKFIPAVLEFKSEVVAASWGHYGGLEGGTSHDLMVLSTPSPIRCGHFRHFISGLVNNTNLVTCY